MSDNLLDVVIVLLLAVATVAINLRMIRDGLNGVGDILWHLTWVQHFSQQIAEGIWYPRWLAGTNYGYGSPTFVFYPPLAYYIGSFLKLAGLNIEQTMAALFSLGLFGAGLNFYIYARKWGKIPAFIGSLCYMTVPGVANLLKGGGLAFLYAMTWIPLGMYLTDQSLEKPKWRAALSIFWAVMALTHVPSLLLCTVVWLFYAVFLLLKRPFQAVLFTILSTGIGFGMVSFYLLPAILEQRFVNIAYQSGPDGGRFRASMINLFKQGTSDIFVQQLSVIIVLAIVVTAICLKGFPKNVLATQEVWRWLAFLILLVFLMTNWSWPIWQASPILQKVQSPGRLGSLFFFGEATLCTIVVSTIFQQPFSFKGLSLIKFLPLVIILGIIFNNFSFAHQLFRKYPALHNPGNGKVENLERLKTALYDPYTDKLIDVPEYRPLLKDGKAVAAPLIGQPPVSIVRGKASIQVNQWHSYKRLFNVTAEETSTIKIRTYYFPAWHLYVNNKAHPIDIADDGTIQVNLDPGSSQVQLRYQWTRIFSLGVGMSLISFVALVFFWVKSPKNPVFKTP
ncbi:MAG: hypothetical protein EAZ77_16975 [Nostocales cyanobacterium]|nr:MAG: hypothetical protein EAZ77_16975 [Nostocales cyanobacterium]